MNRITSIKGALITLSAASYALVSANGYAQPAAFKAGQIAIYASPDEFDGYSIEKYLPYSGITVLSVSPGQELQTVAKLRAQGKRVGINHLAKKSVNSSDPISSLQWHFDKVQANDAWTISKGTGVTVAVLDTGLQTGGEDGVFCIVSGTDIVNSDSDPADGDGHGTHVSGTIAQTTNNNAGVAGLAYESCIMPVKVLGDDGSGSFADIAEGIYYAVDNGAQVINMSLGTNARSGLRNDSIMDPALDYAYQNNVTVIAAAGNDSHRKNVAYPAIYPTTLAIGATGFDNRVPRYSNKGEGLDLVAPGGDLSKDANQDGYGDGVLQETYSDNSWGYWFYQGTSMAAPHVAAVSAMLISANIATTPDSIKAQLIGSTLDLNETGYDNSTGYGLIQAYAALTWDPNNPDDGGSGGEPPTECTDNDGDTFCLEINDCDDNNAQVNPDMNEKGRRRSDGLDNDCNGIIDG